MAIWFSQLVAAIMAASGDISHHIPSSFTLSELLAGVQKQVLASAKTESAKQKMEYFVVLGILASLRCADDRIPQPSSEDDTATTIRDLSLLIAKSITPLHDKTLEDRDDTDMLAVGEDETNQHRHRRELSRHCRTIAPPGIAALESLLARRPAPNKTAAIDDVFLTLIAYTSCDPEDGWTTTEISQQATSVLDAHLPAGSNSRDQFIVDGILQGYLRPLFSKSKPSAITSSGRKAAYVDDQSSARGQGLPDDSALTKPWKFTDYRAIPVVKWTVEEASENLISKHWPLFIPVLLTLVDDNATSVRSRGLVVLTSFLAKFPGKTLHDTGLAHVFEEAVFPTLSFLPGLTPEADSVRLLVPAFAALRSLARKQSSPSSSTPPPSSSSHRSTKSASIATAAVVTAAKEKEYKMLDRVLRQGVFSGYFHAKEYVHIVEVLCRDAGLIVRQMGVHAIKHLKDLIPMLSTTMTDPFAPLSPTTLLAAIQALQDVLATCWPRLSPPSSPWRDEILNALVLCWLHVHEHERDHDKPAANTTAITTDEIKKQLIISASALAAVLRTGTAAEAATATAAAAVSGSGEKWKKKTPAEEEKIKQQEEVGGGRDRTRDPLGELVAPLVSKEPLLAGLFSQPLLPQHQQ